MADKTFTGGEKLEARLAAMARKVKNPGTLKVGFFENATYPDGTFVAMVAAIQEFGAPSIGVPPRSYFRPMIKSKARGWGTAIALNLKATDYDATRTLGLVGKGIAEQLKQSIIDVNSPKLSPVTLMLRKMRSTGGPNYVMSRRKVWEAIRRVRAGESYSGVSTKPLDDTGLMLRKVDSKVET